MKIKKIFALSLLLMGVLAIGGCDIIQKEIERAESIEFVDFEVDIEHRNVYLKITSDADEQVIEEIEVNDESYSLENEGEDWYLLKDVPIETAYEVSSVYYRTSMDMMLSMDVDYEVTIEEGLNIISGDVLHALGNETLKLGGYTFMPNEESLAIIESQKEYTVDELAEWLWVLNEGSTPEYALIEYDETTHVVKFPETAEDYLR
jgi:hypothetical protein